MKILIDDAIPFVRGAFEPFCRVEYLAAKSFTPQRVKDATALIIRTRTRCDAALLQGSSVQYIATATIGFDHIDLQYCAQNGIGVSTSAGCNARGVLQWLSAVLAKLSAAEGWRPSDKCIGIVGVGHVGSLVEQYARHWGFRVLCCDPARGAREGGDFISFESLAQNSDIITLHTPLDDSTRHMINSESLKLISPQTIIINSSRGEVVDTEALLKAGNPFVMDVWEGEPHINVEALARAQVATPHIAGYSLQGKANATTMAVRGVARALGLPLAEWQSDAEHVDASMIEWEELLQSIEQHFDIEALSNMLKGDVSKFESMRNNYDFRMEYF